MAVFGAPVAHEDDPERAVRAALAIRDAVAEMNEQDPELDLHVRIGVTTGEALVSLGGRPSRERGWRAGRRREHAARLQAAAPVDGILVGETTFRSTERAIEYRPVASVEAKGKSRSGRGLGGARGADPATASTSPDGSTPRSSDAVANWRCSATRSIVHAIRASRSS